MSEDISQFNSKKIIGRLERVSFPDLTEDENESIIAKIDTGADNGALHVESLKLATIEGKEFLEFQPVNTQHKIVRTNAFSKVKVKSSNGELQDRFRISTVIVVRGERYPIEITLTDRSEMTYETIIGRHFLKDRFLVDVSIENTQP